MSFLEQYKKYFIISVPLLLSIFTFIIYYPTLVYGFVFDDFPTIIEYIHNRSITFWAQFFQNPRWISRILNQATYAYWKNSATAYRIFNLSLHIITGCLIFALIWNLANRAHKDSFLQKYALLFTSIVTGLFLLHPVQTQTVTYITQMRLEGLVVFFAFAVLLTFVFATQAKTKTTIWGLYILSFACAALAAGTKEIIIVLPFLVLLIDWFFVAQGNVNEFKSRLWIHASYFFIIFGLFYWYGYAQPHAIKSLATHAVQNNRGNILTSSPQEHITLYPFFISQFKVIAHYIAIFVAPFSLSFDYDYKLSRSFFDWDVLAPLMLLLLLVGVLVLRLRKNKKDILVFAGAWFLISILPRASIFPGTELVCDYKTYIASFGIIVALAYGLTYAITFLLEKYSLRALWHPVALCVACFSCLGIVTKFRNNIWSSELAFWGDVIQKAPNKARAYHNYAVALADLGKRQEAIQYFCKAIEHDNHYAEPHINLGIMFHAQNDRARALAHYQRALEIGEAHPELFNGLGMFYFEAGQLAQAEAYLKDAIRYRGYYSLAHSNLARVYLAQNRIKAALQSFEDALAGDNPHISTCYLYGKICCELGNYQQAISVLEQIDKNYEDVPFVLGGCYFSMRKYDLSAKNFEITYQKAPSAASAYNYGLALLNAGKSAQALALFAECRRDDKNYPFAQLHYARCLVETGQKDSARKELVTTLKTIQNPYVKNDIVAYMKEVKLLT